MIIAITADGSLELREPDDFKGFKIFAADPAISDSEVATALTGIAAPDPDGKHFWVAQDALRHWGGTPQSAEWIAAFDKMVEKVKPFGWIDPATGAIRGHLERAN